jgi:hypothetical protein
LNLIVISKKCIRNYLSQEEFTFSSLRVSESLTGVPLLSPCLLSPARTLSIAGSFGSGVTDRDSNIPVEDVAVTVDVVCSLCG